ncbi:MAG TPA: PqqD family protein, partial [Crenotrichaceae bacterium]|nr:PqqD family protein [Crenotrichaceae bacterium]
EEQEMTVGSLCTILSEHFSHNDPDQIKQDVVSFLDECEERGIVLID